MSRSLRHCNVRRAKNTKAVTKVEGDPRGPDGTPDAGDDGSPHVDGGLRESGGLQKRRLGGPGPTAFRNSGGFFFWKAFARGECGLAWRGNDINERCFQWPEMEARVSRNGFGRVKET